VPRPVACSGGIQSPLRGSQDKGQKRNDSSAPVPRARAAGLLSGAPCGASKVGLRCCFFPNTSGVYPPGRASICVICGRCVVVSVAIDITFTGFARRRRPVGSVGRDGRGTVLPPRWGCEERKRREGRGASHCRGGALVISHILAELNEPASAGFARQRRV
jgi:hypothetical protein